tara:strand:- start:827 stop:1327 length:501 start_codon:yes stop_codon:yes gene_type:complete
MALESGTYINSLNASNPVATDGLAQADDHLRLIKSTILSSFPGVTGAVTSTHAELNLLDGVTATTDEINLLDGVTATTAEINYLDGVTSNVQTQIDGILTDVVEDTTPQLGGDLDTNGNKIQFGNWTIEVDSNNDLLFKYSNNTRIRMTSAGALDVEDDITAFSGI